jgi:hypothetical protein
VCARWGHARPSLGARRDAGTTDHSQGFCAFYASHQALTAICQTDDRVSEADLGKVCEEVEAAVARTTAVVARSPSEGWCQLRRRLVAALAFVAKTHSSSACSHALRAIAAALEFLLPAYRRADSVPGPDETASQLTRWVVIRATDRARCFWNAGFSVASLDVSVRIEAAGTPTCYLGPYGQGLWIDTRRNPKTVTIYWTQGEPKRLATYLRLNTGITAQVVHLLTPGKVERATTARRGWLTFLTAANELDEANERIGGARPTAFLVAQANAMSRLLAEESHGDAGERLFPDAAEQAGWEAAKAWHDELQRTYERSADGPMWCVVAPHHRIAGYPLFHVVTKLSFRAGGCEMCATSAGNETSTFPCPPLRPFLERLAQRAQTDTPLRNCLAAAAAAVGANELAALMQARLR